MSCSHRGFLNSSTSQAYSAKIDKNLPRQGTNKIVAKRRSNSRHSLCHRSSPEGLHDSSLGCLCSNRLNWTLCTTSGTRRSSLEGASNEACMPSRPSIRIGVPGMHIQRPEPQQTPPGIVVRFPKFTRATRSHRLCPAASTTATRQISGPQSMPKTMLVTGGIQKLRHGLGWV